MEKLGVEKAYASALIDVAIEAGKEAQINEDIAALDVVMKENPELLKMLQTPSVSKADKHSMIENIFGGKVQDEVINFMLLLADNSRYYCWPEIMKAYKKLLDEKQGLVSGVVYSVKPLSKDVLAKVEASVGAQLGEQLKLENRVDETLIGGFKVFVDGKVVDASFKTGLENIRKSMQV